jgi:hypothetical protein
MKSKGIPAVVIVVLAVLGGGASSAQDAGEAKYTV